MLLGGAGWAADPIDQARWQKGKDSLELDWSDAEDRVRATLSPAPLRVGQPAELSLDIGSFQGPAFEGPVTVGLKRAEAAPGGQTYLPTRNERNWHTTVTPQEEGPFVLDIGFRSSRYKVVHAVIEVQPSPGARYDQAALGLLVASGAGFAVFQLIRALKQRSSSPG